MTKLSLFLNMTFKLNRNNYARLLHDRCLKVRPIGYHTIRRAIKGIGEPTKKTIDTICEALGQPYNNLF